MSDQVADTAPRFASTVLLVQDDESGVQVFMEKRHIKSDFVGGAYVFPGGRVDPEDTVPESLCAGLTESSANQKLGLERGGLAFYAAAIRECFEEAGILLAYDKNGELLDFSEPTRDAHYRQLRDALNAGDLSLVEIAQQEELILATDLVAYWAHWITPEGQPRRYDTRFFIARAPTGQTAAHDDWELTESAWVHPSEAIERSRKKEWMIIFPTLKNLEQLGRLATTKAALAWAEGDHERPVMQPRILENRVVLPGDDGYDQAPSDTSKVDQKAWAKQHPAKGA